MKMEKFLEAEEAAFKLVETLKQLHSEATSYQKAREELEAVREQLTKFIAVAQETASGSHDVIKTLKEIGTPEILSKLSQLLNESAQIGEKSNRILDSITLLQSTLQQMQNTLLNESAQIGEKSNRILESTTLLHSTLQEIQNTLSRIEKESNQFFNEISKKIEGKSAHLQTSLSTMENRVFEQFKNQLQFAKKLKNLIITTLTVSITSLVVGVISLIMR